MWPILSLRFRSASVVAAPGEPHPAKGIGTINDESDPAGPMGGPWSWECIHEYPANGLDRPVEQHDP